MISFRNMLVLAVFGGSTILQMHLRWGDQISSAFHAPCSPSQELMDMPPEAQRFLLGINAARHANNTAIISTNTATDITTKTTTETGISTTISHEETGLNKPHSKMLPMPNENGIIIFYFHIPKTGGTTQRLPFDEHPDWRYRMVYGKAKQRRYAKEMYDLLEHWPPKNKVTKVYYEYHAGTAPAYMDLTVRQDVLVWRAMAQIRNIPFFAFTVLREPLSMAVSHFNFYYANPKFDSRYYWRPEATEKDFLELSMPNPQCMFTVKREISYYESHRKKHGHKADFHVDRQDCEDVYDAFVNDFDWIGTTDTLSDQTFKILEQLGGVRYCGNIENTSENRIEKSKLSDQALQHVRKTTSYDQFLYDRARRDYPISMWKNFDPPQGPPPVHPKRKECEYKRGQELPPGELPKRKGARRRFLEKHPNFVEVKDIDSPEV